MVFPDVYPGMQGQSVIAGPRLYSLAVTVVKIVLALEINGAKFIIKLLAVA